MGSILTTLEEVKDEARKMDVSFIPDLSALSEYNVSYLNIPELEDLLRQHLHLELVKGIDGDVKLLCSDFGASGGTIPLIRKILKEKKIEYKVFAVTDEITRYFSSAGSKERKNDKANSKGAESISLQNLEVLLYDAIEMKASDIRIEINKDATRVTYRVDKVLCKSRFDNTNVEWGELIGNCIFSFLPATVGNQSSGEYNKLDTVDATFTAADKRWRAGLFPADAGPVISIRELGKSTDSVASLEDLGFEPEQALVIRDCVSRGQGLFLVTGPTSSGKSTSQSSLVCEMNDGSRAIYALEDPVERLIPGIYQATVDNDNKSRTFKVLGRQLLRQNPDVIVYGEIRSQETAEAAIRMGTTGHMVMGTLHTASAIGAVVSLSFDLGIPASRLCDPHLLRGSLYQRLINKTCKHCGVNWQEKKETLNPYEITRLEKHFTDMEKWRFINPRGCKACNHRGFKGMTVVAEVVPIDSPALEFISKMDSHGWEKYIFDKKGWLNIKKHALLKIARGELDYFACENQLDDLTQTTAYYEFDIEAIKERAKYVQ